MSRIRGQLVGGKMSETLRVGMQNVWGTAQVSLTGALTRDSARTVANLNAASAMTPTSRWTSHMCPGSIPL